MMSSPSSSERIDEEVNEGFRFVMEMLTEDCAFPRTVSTGATRGAQYTVNSRDEAMTYFKASLYQDCYLNAYANYEAMIKSARLSPRYKPLPPHFMIDLDKEPFGLETELEEALANTLTNIRENITGLAGQHPIVIASGSGGYHIHIPIDGWGRRSLEDMPEFEAFSKDQDLTNKLLRYAERRLSNGKVDHCHSPSIKSMMFRIPGTINTKAKALGRENPIVRIVEGHEQLIKRLMPVPPPFDEQDVSKPTTKFLNDFYAYLVQQQINNEIAKSDKRLVASRIRDTIGNNSIWWIEKLLQTGVDDGRKDLLFWVLAPYLITVRRLDYDKAYSVLEGWLEGCDDVRQLEPDWTSFRYRIRYCLEAAE